MESTSSDHSTVKASLSHFIQFCIVILSCIIAFSIRLFSVTINEEIIHEFDPHFNWRCTQYINEHGLYEFLGWFDNISWYPQGRPVGQTAYPGLMYTSALTKWALQKLNIEIDLIKICIYTGPVFSVFTVLLSFLFGQLIGSSQLGCLCGACIAIVPGLISRSVAGGYDYECNALFILIGSMYTFALALRDGSIFYSILSSLFYGYMALSWGGYVFISNCIPLFTCGLIALGRYSWRLHITYSIWAIFGTIFAASIPFVHEKCLIKPEHFAMLITFFAIQVWGLFTRFHSFFSKETFSTLIVSSALILPGAFLVILAFGISTGLISGFSGRLLVMFDPSYATKHIPIIASVAEHQPSSWGMFFMDCGFLLLAFPVGCFFLLKRSSEIDLLLLIWGMSTLYFASIMVRLVLVFSPVMALIAAVGLHNIMKAAAKSINNIMRITAFLLCSFVTVLTLLHSVWFSCYSYSGDQIHLTVRTPQGIQSADDYREAYRWLWSNTHHDERVLSWWDYGYQITSMGGRGCMADGNTNNFTHIGIIGMTMSSPEQQSWRLARMMDMDYTLVVFGGASGYDGDDINKFLWMPKIANQTFTNISGDMYVTRNDGLIGSHPTKNMTLSMMYHFAYNNFDKFQFHSSLPKGTDIARMARPPTDNLKMTMFEEAYTTKNWIIRMYKVKGDPLWNRVY